MTATGQDSPPAEPTPALRFTAETTGGKSLVCAGPDDTLYAAANDPIEGATVFRLSPSGDVLWRALPLPGQSTFASAIVADEQGNLYVAGATLPSGTPRPPLDGQRSPTGLANTAFVIRIRPEGSMSQPLIFTRPHANYTSITALTMEPGGNRILAGGLIGNIGSAIVAKSFLAWVDRTTLQMETLAAEVGGLTNNCSGGSVCIGTAHMTRISQIHFDPIHQVALVQGSTTTNDFATPGAIQESCYCTNGRSTGWVGAFDLASGARLYTTYLSGHRQYLDGFQSFGSEAITGLHWSERRPDQIVITGITGSPGFPTTPGAYSSEFNCREYVLCRIETTFLATIDWKNNRLVSSTLYGERAAGGPSIGLIEDPAGRGYWLTSANFLALFDPDGTSLLAELKLPDQLAAGFIAAVPGGFAMCGDYRVSRYDLPSAPEAGGIDSISQEAKDGQPGPAAIGLVPGFTYQVHGNFPARSLRAFVWGVEAELKPVAGSTDRLRVTLPPAIPGVGNMVDLSMAEAESGAVHSTVSVNFYPELFRIVTCQNAAGVTVGGADGARVQAGTIITCKLRGALPGQAIAYGWSDPLKRPESQTWEPGGEQTVAVLTPSVTTESVGSISFRAGARVTDGRQFLISPR